jgi:hypothetical protein
VYEQNSWYKYDYSYSFDGCCLKTTTFTDSDNYTWTNADEECCYLDSYEIITNATCTQSGLGCNICVVCERQADCYEIQPKDHSWVYVENNLYYCYDCGIENANGVSGDVIMEDLTTKYGDGEYYVAGYFINTGVDFSTYVSLVDANGDELAIVEGVEFITLEDVRAIKFSKAYVVEWATLNGYENYNVKLSFVPDGADGSFDYAVTFTEPEILTGTITDSVKFIEYFEPNALKDYVFEMQENTVWNFWSRTDRCVSAVLYEIVDGEKVYVQGVHDGEDFYIAYELEGGKSYVLTVCWRNEGYDGYMALLFNKY